MSERIIAACDGSSKGNPGPAGWAWVVAGPDGSPQRWESGALGVSTNNVGELTALLRLLEAVDAAQPLEVRMDSQYAMKSVTQWLAGWKRNGWKTASGKPVANREIVEQIDRLLTDRDVEFVYVPAHRVDGDLLNAVADQAASDAAEAQQGSGTALGDAEPPAPQPSRAAPAASTRRRSPSAKKPSGAAAATIKAKFPGRCPCGQPYAAGTQITKLDRGWGHPQCRKAI
ncbi:RNase H family protein [Streptomyces sp. NPDC006879]|uniref:ribonuclease H family protein n=1 Tax=Streptomyces sp. NPDC006879 TaxID=3364767 RepID=UPI0036C32AE2